MPNHGEDDHLGSIDETGDGASPDEQQAAVNAAQDFLAPGAIPTPNGLSLPAPFGDLASPGLGGTMAPSHMVSAQNF